ncbi:MAG TPA: phytoene/squalene synthase family protein [Spirochaetia bacterium]|nr:phytoene/squalene synthase family protein [Spirochaetia bacterium]
MKRIDKVHLTTFRNGSKTYFNSSLFFPEDVRRDVFTLYGFVRVADDFVDDVPQDRVGFRSFVDRYRVMRSGRSSGDLIIDSFGELMERREFDPAWVDSFIASMEMDLSRNAYDSIEELLAYIDGSAEVIGLMMAKLLELPEASYPYARMLGRAMQHINFIRDISEDRELGRRYLPMAGSGLECLDSLEAGVKPEKFRSFIRGEIDRYRNWQREAERGFRFIPRRYLVPIKTASDMYKWTADQIAHDPFIVYRRKVKPTKVTILSTLIANTLSGRTNDYGSGSQRAARSTA